MQASCCTREEMQNRFQQSPETVSKWLAKLSRAGRVFPDNGPNAVYNMFNMESSVVAMG